MSTKSIVKKCFEGFADNFKKKDSYKKFYEPFGKFLNLAIHGNSTIQTEIAEPVRFSNSKSGDELSRMKEHVDRMEAAGE